MTQSRRSGLLGSLAGDAGRPPGPLRFGQGIFDVPKQVAKTIKKFSMPPPAAGDKTIVAGDVNWPRVTKLYDAMMLKREALSLDVFRKNSLAVLSWTS